MLIAAAAMVACDEVEEESAFDNWQVRNQQLVDSLHAAAGDRYVSLDEEGADAMQPGELFYFKNPTASSTEGDQYIYCKKLVANTTGKRPVYRGPGSTVSAYYYGTLITGDRFDGNFEGYSLADTREMPATPFDRAPSAFDSPTSFGVTEVISGWTWALQLMRTGERWMLYLPQQSGYGPSSNGGIPAHSVLMFDLVLDGVE